MPFGVFFFGLPLLFKQGERKKKGRMKCRLKTLCVNKFCAEIGDFYTIRTT